MAAGRTAELCAAEKDSLPERHTHSPAAPPQTFSTPSRPWETPKISHSSLRHTDARMATHITTRVPPDLCSLVKVFMKRTQKKKKKEK